MAKLADALDLGSSGQPYGFKSLQLHQKMAMSMWHKPFFCIFHQIRDLNGWESQTLGQTVVVCLRQMMDTHQLPPRRDSEAEQVPSTAPLTT